MRKTLPMFILFLLLAGGAMLYSWVSGPPGRGPARVFVVERGWGAADVARALEDSGLARSRYYVLWRAGQMGVSSGLQAGRYMLSPSMPPDTLLAIISSGRVIPVPTHWVTVPEGLDMEATLQLLSDTLERPLEPLLTAAGDPSLPESLGIPGLEGYLFPETYEFPDTLSPRALLARMVTTGLERWDADLTPAFLALGLSREQGVTLASIVEREAKVDGERAVIAGVFLARLRRGMRLESCATVIYALGGECATLTYADLRLEHPYNTYLIQGLPPGPICSPGLEALQAAAYPDTSAGWLYFVAREDGSGGHLFATTLSGHNANIRSIRSGVH